MAGSKAVMSECELYDNPTSPNRRNNRFPMCAPRNDEGG